MKNILDINAYGVQEMNHQEMVETEGGFLPLVVAAVVVVAAACAGCGSKDTGKDNETTVIYMEGKGNKIIITDKNDTSKKGN